MHNCKTKNTKSLCELLIKTPQYSFVMANLWWIYGTTIFHEFTWKQCDTNAKHFLSCYHFPHMIYGYLKNSVSLLELPSNLGKYTCYS